MGIAIPTSETFTIEYEGSQFECRLLLHGELAAIGQAALADERTGRVDEIGLIIAIAEASICEWSGVSSEETGDSLGYSPELVKFLPTDLLVKITNRISSRYVKQSPAPNGVAPAAEVLPAPLPAPSVSSNM